MIVTEIIEAVRRVVKTKGIVPLHEPVFNGNEWKYVKDCLDSGWVSSTGEYVTRFEEELTRFIGAKRAVAVVNGTAALHIALQLVGVRSNDEVLVPALTFVATANAVTYCGAIPHFVDISEKTLGIDPIKLERYLEDISVVTEGGCINKQTGRKIKAVVAMHTFGHPVDLDPLLDVCKKFHLELVEDAAEALGSFYKGRHVGTFGKVAAFSFNGNKIITTGGGGAIVTNDEALAELAKHLTTTAKIPHPWEYVHDQVGYNYRMPNLNAALGLAQLEQLPEFIEKKRKLATLYQNAFTGLQGITFVSEPPHSQSNYWLNTIILDREFINFRDEILEAFHQDGFMCRPVWRPMHQLPIYSQNPKMDLCITEDLARRIINIPSGVGVFNLDE